MIGRFFVVACGLVVVACLSSSGCGAKRPPVPELSPVSGKITFEGKPVPGAKIVFIPANEDPKKPPETRPAAESDDAGNYSLMWDENEGAPPGNYKVIIMAFKQVDEEDDEVKPPSLIPERYSSPKLSGLKAVVKEDDNVIDFPLVP
jgi:hypothetical protein